MVVCHVACRNAIVLSPHVRAAKCSIEAARIVREAAEAAGAPKGLIQWIEKPSLALATALMKDPNINLILATGAAGAFCGWKAGKHITQFLLWFGALHARAGLLR
jgi:acyl-CoA reductase-like NAD-dependent aldehyde dehydrogenase